MPQIWIYHPHLNKRVWIDLPPNIKPNKFKQFAQTLLNNFKKLEQFSIKEAMELTNVKYETTKKYLEIMNENELIKPIKAQPEKEWIISCNPKEDLISSIISIGSELAARSFQRRMRFVNRIIDIINNREPILKIRKERPILRRIFNFMYDTLIRRSL